MICVLLPMLISHLYQRMIVLLHARFQVPLANAKSKVLVCARFKRSWQCYGLSPPWGFGSLVYACWSKLSNVSNFTAHQSPKGSPCFLANVNSKFRLAHVRINVMYESHWLAPFSNLLSILSACQFFLSALDNPPVGVFSLPFLLPREGRCVPPFGCIPG